MVSPLFQLTKEPEPTPEPTPEVETPSQAAQEPLQEPLEPQVPNGMGFLVNARTEALRTDQQDAGRSGYWDLTKASFTEYNTTANRHAVSKAHQEAGVTPYQTRYGEEVAIPEAPVSLIDNAFTKNLVSVLGGAASRVQDFFGIEDKGIQSPELEVPIQEWREMDIEEHFPWLFEYEGGQIPDQYRKVILNSNNLEDAKVKSIRIKESLKNQALMEEHHWGTELVAGAAASILDPEALLAMRTGQVFGKGVLSATGLAQTAQALKYSNSRAARTAYGAITGTAVGAVGTGYSAGSRLENDPATLAEHYYAEQASSALFSLTLPFVGFAAGGVAGRVRQPRGTTGRADLDLVAERMLQARRDVAAGTRNIADRTAEGASGIVGPLSITNVIAGKTRYDVVANAGEKLSPAHMELGSKLFESARGDGGRAPRPNTADMSKEIYSNQWTTDLAYNLRLEKWLSQTNKSRFTSEFKAKWTNSELRQQHDDQVMRYMLDLDAGRNPEAFGPLTGADKIALDNAKHFRKVMEGINQKQFAGGVEDVPFYRYIDGETSKPVSTPIEFSARKVNARLEELIPLTEKKSRAEAQAMIEDRIAGLYKSNLQNNKLLTESLTQFFEGRNTGLSLFEQTQVIEGLLDSLAAELSRGQVRHALQKRTGVSTVGKSTPAQVVDEVVDLVGRNRGFSAEDERILRSILLDSSAAYPVVRNARDVDALHGVIDTDLGLTLSRQIEEGSGRLALAEAGLTSAHAYREATKKLSDEAALKGIPYPKNFWKDTYRSFMGQPTEGMTSDLGLLGPNMRRLRTLGGQVNLGMAGFSMVSDTAQVLAMGFPGIKGLTHSVPGALKQMVNRNSRDEVLASLESMTGDLISRHRFARGDVFLDQISVREAQEMGMWKQGTQWVGQKVDNTLAYSDRLLGAMSGMNTVNNFSAMATEKSVLHQIGRYMQGKSPEREIRRLTDMGFDEARLEALRPIWKEAVTYGKFGGIKKLDASKFTAEQEAIMSRGMTRAVKQILGEGLIGETPHRMATPLMDIAMQLRRTTLLQHEKTLRRNLELGATPFFQMAIGGMAVAYAMTYSREYMKHLAAELDHDAAVAETEARLKDGTAWSPHVRRAVSMAPGLGGVTDTSSMALAPLFAFFDEDIANNLHFGYDRYSYGPPRGGFDFFADEIPAAGYFEDVVKTGQGAAGRDWDKFVEGFFGVAPLGNTFPALILMNLMLEDDDSSSGGLY